MEPLKKLKSVQVLTDESIYQIERAINFLKTFNESVNNVRVYENIDKLKAIIEDVKS
jgi:flagellin-specific chaperone FliS